MAPGKPGSTRMMQTHSVAFAAIGRNSKWPELLSRPAQLAARRARTTRPQALLTTIMSQIAHGPPFPRGREVGYAPHQRHRFAVEVGEDDFVGKQRGPFKCSGAVGVRAADEFVLTVGQFHQFGLAELADEAAAEALRNDVVQFHAPPPYRRGLDIGGPC